MMILIQRIYKIFVVEEISKIDRFGTKFGIYIYNIIIHI